MKCNLKAHLETHKSVEERSFKCSQCSHTATTLPLLRLHMHSHTGERPYVCELCGESYRRPSNLRRHKKNMCKLRPGAPQDQGDEEMGIEGEEGGVYERIETVVVQVKNAFSYFFIVGSSFILFLIYRMEMKERSSLRRRSMRKARYLSKMGF